jgi:hypothetical protein
MQLHIIENNKNNYNQLYNKCGIVRIHIPQGFKWIELVKSTFDEIGFSFMYYDQQYGSADWLKTYVKQIHYLFICTQIHHQPNSLV